MDIGHTGKLAINYRRLHMKIIEAFNAQPPCRYRPFGEPQAIADWNEKERKRIALTPYGKHCARMKQLDKRYRAKYGMSMIENIQEIKAKGIRQFTRDQKQKWTCPDCGKLLTVHRRCVFIVDMCGTNEDPRRR